MKTIYEFTNIDYREATSADNYLALRDNLRVKTYKIPATIPDYCKAYIGKPFTVTCQTAASEGTDYRYTRAEIHTILDELYRSVDCVINDAVTIGEDGLTVSSPLADDKLVLNVTSTEL